MARDYCFTLFNNIVLDFDKDKIKYICYGVERCPESGREHKQGFVIFNRTCRVPKAKSWIGGGDSIHLESRRGTRGEARDYCFKSDESPFEWGQFDGMTHEQLFKKNKAWLLSNGYEAFYCRFYRAINAIQEKGDKWREVTVMWLWGAPGTNKTRRVMEMESVFKLDYPYKWFDGYEGEDTLLLDDFKDGVIERGMLLNLLDGYRLRLETKGGHCWALWTKVFITSNKCPQKMNCWDSALARRCDNVTGCG